MSTGQSDTITAHTFYIAHCAECGGTADGDGEEYRSTPADAVAYVQDTHEWSRVDGHLFCSDCDPIDWDEEP